MKPERKVFVLDSASNNYSQAEWNQVNIGDWVSFENPNGSSVEIDNLSSFEVTSVSSTLIGVARQSSPRLKVDEIFGDWFSNTIFIMRYPE